MATKVTSKKANSVNNRPNCLKITKRMQKVNLQTVTTSDGKKTAIVRFDEFSLNESVTYFETTSPFKRPPIPSEHAATKPFSYKLSIGETYNESS